MRLALVPFLVALASCATITGRGTYHVPVDSVPAGAAVSYRGARVGVTPCTVVMSTQSSRITLQLDGYHDQVAEAGSSVNPMLFGNILFGGLVGLAIDGVSGAGGQISETPMLIALTPAAEPEPDVWGRPPAPPIDENEGWVREDGTPLEVKKAEAPIATRARPKPPPSGDDDGWIPAGEVSK